jgi:large subunit ribosomal protein L26e
VFFLGVTSSRRKQRKAHFSAPSHERRIRMSATLSKDLRAKFGIRSAPIRKDDEILIRHGKHAEKEGKVTLVSRSKYVIHVEKVAREKVNGQTVQIGIHPSNVIITKLHADKNRDALIERRSKAKQAAAKGEKYSSKANAMAVVD